MRRTTKWGASALVLSAALTAASCATRPRAAPPVPDCATRYPILLVHGIAARDGGLAPCWGRVPAALRSRGARVFMAGNDGLATIARNAEVLAGRIDEVLAETGSEKVNLIAHSKGGLEARYCISTMGYGGKVASLTTVCTPHRGSALAVYFLDDFPLVNRFSAFLCDAWAVGIDGDRSSDAYASMGELRPESCAAFNLANPDDPRVYYRSYAAEIDEGFGIPLYIELYRILRDREGPNDGLVSVESARWGDFRGVIGAEAGALVSHGDAQDNPFLRNEGVFDIPVFYASMVHELMMMGY